MASIQALFQRPADLTPLPAPLDDFRKLVKSSITPQDKVPVHYRGKAFEDYLKSKTVEWFGRDFSNSDEHIAEQLFITVFDTPDFKLWLKFQMLGMRASLKRLLAQADSCDQNDSETWRGAVGLLLELTHDSVAILEYGEKQFNGVVVEYAFGITRKLSSVEVWKASHHMFHSVLRPRTLGESAYRSTAIFLIRQALELRMKNIFGVAFIELPNGRPAKTDISFFISLVLHYKKAIRLPVKISLIDKINKWSNIYVHGGIQPNAWEIEWAHHILSPLFDHGSFEGTKSVYGAVQISESIFETIQDVISSRLRPAEQTNWIKTVVEIIKKPFRSGERPPSTARVTIHFSNLEAIVIPAPKFDELTRQSTPKS